MSPFATFLIGLGIGAAIVLLLQVWRVKAEKTTTIGPVVSALANAMGSPAATSAQAWVDAAWLKFVTDAKAVIDKEFEAAKVPTPPAAGSAPVPSPATIPFSTTPKA